MLGKYTGRVKQGSIREAMRHCLLYAPSLSMQLISLLDSVRIQTCSESVWTVTLVQCWTSVLQMTREMDLLCRVYGVSNQNDFEKSQGWGPHRVGILLTLSVAEIKYWPKTPWGRMGLFLHILYNPSPVKTKAGTQGRNRSRNYRETLFTGLLYMACFLL